ncbi:MAG: hypothetical protein KBT85_03055 [Pseudomonas sp.]|nr:hypothetical protein [Pseudomonas sp.]
MKTIKLSNILHISALSLTLGLVSGFATAGDTSKHEAEDGTRMDGQHSQQHDEQMSRDTDLESTTRSGTDDMPGQGDTDPAGTDATRSVPGAPEKGTNPATEPGDDMN